MCISVDYVGSSRCSKVLSALSRYIEVYSASVSDFGVFGDKGLQFRYIYTRQHEAWHRSRGT